MPELPDVEVFRRTLDRGALHRRVVRVARAEGRVIQSSKRTLARRLEGHRLEESRRRGKHLLVRLDKDGGWLLLHFGMTGALQVSGADEEPSAHARLVLDLDDGRHLVYESQRMFGRVEVVDDAERYLEEHKVGPDALSLGQADFVARLQGRTGALKPALMNQRTLAGIGNVYADEVLFQARLHPETAVGALDERTLSRLYRSMVRVLRETIKRGADPARMPRTWLLPHRAPGQRCPRCRTPLEKLQVGGRGTWICPREQPRA